MFHSNLYSLQSNLSSVSVFPKNNCCGFKVKTRFCLIWVWQVLVATRVFLTNDRSFGEVWSISIVPSCHWISWPTCQMIVDIFWNKTIYADLERTGSNWNEANRSELNRSRRESTVLFVVSSLSKLITMICMNIKSWQIFSVHQVYLELQSLCLDLPLLC